MTRYAEYTKRRLGLQLALSSPQELCLPAAAVTASSGGGSGCDCQAAAAAASGSKPISRL